MQLLMIENLTYRKWNILIDDLTIKITTVVKYVCKKKGKEKITIQTENIFTYRAYHKHSDMRTHHHRQMRARALIHNYTKTNQQTHTKTHISLRHIRGISLFMNVCFYLFSVSSWDLLFEQLGPNSMSYRMDLIALVYWSSLTV